MKERVMDERVMNGVTNVRRTPTLGALRQAHNQQRQQQPQAMHHHLLFVYFQNPTTTKIHSISGPSTTKNKTNNNDNAQY